MASFEIADFNRRLRRMIICLRISSVLYFVVAAVFLVLFAGILAFEHRVGSAVVMLFVALLSTVFGVVVENAISGLRRRQKGAWMCSIGLAALFCVSILFVLGILLLIDLMNEEVTKVYLRD